MPQLDKAEREKELCQRYLSENISTARLALDYSLSEIRVRQILKANGVSKEDRPPNVAMKEVDKTFSEQHVRIGKLLSKQRMVVLGVDRSEVCAQLGWAVHKLALVEKGEFNLTLFDLNDIAKFLETPSGELLESTAIPKQANQTTTEGND